MHDWGCLYGYQFALRHPELVSRIVGVDIGDAGSKAHQAELGAKAKLMVLAYQLWLAAAWRIGGALGNLMARRMAAAMRCPAEPQTIGAQMGYPYAVQWFSASTVRSHRRSVSGQPWIITTASAPSPSTWTSMPSIFMAAIVA